MNKQQRGGSFLGFILGLVVGLAGALAVAVYVTKVPVPFLNKNGTRAPDQEAEDKRNKNWDPNAPLYGKNPARPVTPAPEEAAKGEAPAAAPETAAAPASAPAARAGKPEAAAPSDDPLGDLARAKSKTAPAPAEADPFQYFVQAGAFRTQQDADAQRAKLAMLGWEARVSERETNGRTVFRVRVGPFAKRDDAESLKGKLDGAGVDSALVRVQR